MKKLILLCILFALRSANAQILDTSIIHLMETAIGNQTYKNIHSVLITHNNKIIYEQY